MSLAAVLRQKGLVVQTLRAKDQPLSTRHNKVTSMVTSILELLHLPHFELQPFNHGFMQRQSPGCAFYSTAARR